MWTWIIANGGTLFVSLLLLGLLSGIVLHLYRDKRKGKPSCGCGCGCEGCAMAGKCHGDHHAQHLP